MGLNSDFWRGRRVFITGHTGFKGGWFLLWLHKLAASVSGYSLAPPTEPSFYAVTGAGEDVHSTHGDVRDLNALQSAMQDVDPEIAFHFAAQPLVRASYDDPAYTYAANVMGTVHFLESVRQTPSVRAAVVVTSDKCYENSLNTTRCHRESDPMGGRSPYASSKGCAELIIAAYRDSFFDNSGVRLASVRAGNVIGGGDWAQDRLVPDMIRAFGQGRELQLRNANAVRPWQHVLDPLHGYLVLAQKLYLNSKGFCKAWNFGPKGSRAWTVLDIVRQSSRLWGLNARWSVCPTKGPIEDKHLDIDAAMAQTHLQWVPKLDMQTTLQWTIDWYRAHLSGDVDMRQFSLQQISQFELLQ